MDQAYEHVDLAAYQLHLHATKEHCKGVMKKKDVPDLVGRLETMHPSVGKRDIPKVDVAYLPECIKSFIISSDTFQVVWMYNGTCSFLQSSPWKSRFAISRRGEKRLYKMIETLGFSDFEAHHKMWIESLYHVGSVVFYEGRAFRQDVSEVVYQKAKMLSFVVDYSNIITATIVV